MSARAQQFSPDTLICLFSFLDLQTSQFRNFVLGQKKNTHLNPSKGIFFMFDRFSEQVILMENI